MVMILIIINPKDDDDDDDDDDDVEGAPAHIATFLDQPATRRLPTGHSPDFHLNSNLFTVSVPVTDMAILGPTSHFPAFHPNSKYNRG